MIVQDEEIADALELECRLRVVSIAEHGIEIAARKQLHKPNDPRLNQEYRGRLERLEEAAGEADRDARSCSTSLRRLPVVKRSGRGVGERLAVEIREQRRRGLVVAEEAAASRHSRCRCGAAAECATASPASRAVERV